MKSGHIIDSHFTTLNFVVGDSEIRSVVRKILNVKITFKAFGWMVYYVLSALLCEVYE